MAKVKFSALISEMRNKLNGSVFSKNRGGNYLRNKVTPVNPNTSAQSLVRAVFSSLASGWRDLTESQRDAWHAAVNDYKTTDIFGDVKVPSGSNLYQKVNLNLINAEIAPINVPALVSGVDQVGIVSFAASEAGNADLLMSGSIPANTTMIIETSAPVSAGINSNTITGSKLTKADAGIAPAIDFGAEYTAKFGAMVSGTKIFVKVKFINNTTGQASNRQVISAIVTA